MMASRIGQKLWNLGQMDGLRKAIMGALDFRFGTEVAQSFAEAINALDDLDRLNELHSLAFRGANPDEFRLSLVGPTPRRRRRT